MLQPTADLLIEAQHLERHFGEKQAVHDVSFQVSAGEIYGLVGPDGAGKTTTLRLLCGAYQPTPLDGYAQVIRICGIDLLKQPEQARANIGYLSQRFSLYEDLTVLENIRFFAELRGLPAAEWRPRCMQILEFVGLGQFTNRRAGQLSGGMKQKLGLASALVTRPRVLLLDEPTTGVDPVTRQDFWQLIIRLVSEPADGQGVCVLVSTPYMDEAARCHRLGFMRRGRIVAEGTPCRLRAMLEERILELRGAPLPVLRAAAAQDPAVDDVRTFGDRLHLRLKAPGGVGQLGDADQPGGAGAVIERLQAAALAAGAASAEARAIPATLEDVFMALAEEEPA
ncbi:MAG: ABC transporter ATP-binding protein [Chloroflexota bacterium]